MFSFSNNPSIDIITGPMYSGKSSELIRRLNIYVESGKRVLFVNSSLDNRDIERIFSTHNNTIGTVNINTVRLLTLHNLDTTNYDVIGIDEAQFFTDLKDSVINMVDNFNKIVVIAGLNGDFRRQPFGQILDLIPYCDTIVKLHPFCFICKEKDTLITPALFTKKINNISNNISNNLNIDIGSYNKYMPVCRKCFKLHI